MTRKTRFATLTTAVAVAAAGALAPVASAQTDLLGTPPPKDERCKVPALLYQAAAVVDPDSLEGCNFFEDPNYHENRKAQGSYTDQGVFSTIFG